MACSGTPYLLLRLTGRSFKGCRTRSPRLSAGCRAPGIGVTAATAALRHQVPGEPDAVERPPVAQGELEPQERVERGRVVPGRLREVQVVPDPVAVAADHPQPLARQGALDVSGGDLAHVVV